MWKIKLVLCALFTLSCSYRSIRKCSDCRFIHMCPDHDKIVSSNADKIKSAFCGTEMLNGHKKPKICCSDFTEDAESTMDSDEIGMVMPSMPGGGRPRVGMPNVEPPSGNPPSVETPSVDTESSMPNRLDTRFSSMNSELLPDDCGVIDLNRIVGGAIPNLREFPWMALIAVRTRYHRHERDLFKCSGSIISPRYILTAAHCVVGKQLSKIRVGDFEIGKKVDSVGEHPHIDYESHLQEVDIEDKIVHEEYNNETKKADIALIRVKQEIDCSYSNVKPICLPLEEGLRNVALANQLATVAGWGLTEEGRDTNILRKVEIPIYTQANCQQIYDATNKLCAGALGKDSCRGDSGGPLMVEGDVQGKVRMVQYGIVSFGPTNCASYTPGVYTDVSKYMDWILEHIKP